MNNRGFVTLLVYMLILVIAIFALIWQTNPDVDPEPVKGNLTTLEHLSSLQVNETDGPITAVVKRWSDAFVFSATQLAKVGVDFAATNPEGHWKLIIWGVILAIFAPIALVLFKFSLILFIFIKDLLAARREKRELRRLRDDRRKRRET